MDKRETILCEDRKEGDEGQMWDIREISTLKAKAVKVLTNGAEKRKTERIFFISYHKT